MLPEGWKETTVGEGCCIKNNLRFPICSDARTAIHGQYPYFGPTGILNFINEYRIDEEFSLIGEDGDHFLKSSEKEMTLFYTGKANVNNHAHIICNSKLCTAKWFSLYFLHKDLTQFITRQGAKRYKLTKATLEQLPIFLPPLPEQQKIAEILTAWDKAISTTDALVENSRQQKKALMQQLLTGKKRLAGFSGEWKEKFLGECIICLDNQRLPLSDKQRLNKNGKIPYYGANGIVDYINEYIFNEDLILLAEDGGYFSEYNKRPIAQIIYGKSWVNNHAHALKARKNIYSRWIYYALVHKNIIPYINGGTRAKLNQADMLRIPLILPPLPEQRAIAAVLTAADREIALLEQKAAGLREEKKALMQQLLTGKKRVSI